MYKALFHHQTNPSELYYISIYFCKAYIAIRVCDLAKSLGKIQTSDQDPIHLLLKLSMYVAVLLRSDFNFDAKQDC
jgi:hypothetical protein